jgi:hypothetical protein
MDYSSTGAPTGQASAQEPQATHSSALITYLPSPSVMQPTGQASAQAPQLTQSSLILYAMVITSISDILIVAKSKVKIKCFCKKR